MKSKIRVEYDFDKKEPYLQLYLESNPEDPDLKDSMLKAFIQHAESTVGNERKASLMIFYPENNVDNCCPQIRIQPDGVTLWENSKQLKDWLIGYNIDVKNTGASLTVPHNVDLFILGREYERYINSLPKPIVDQTE